TSGSTRSSLKARTIRRARIASSSSMGASGPVGSGQLQEIVGRGPAERDQRIATLLVDLREELRVALDLLGLERLVIEHLGVGAVAANDERALVVAARVDAEALGQATAPGPLLA